MSKIKAVIFDLDGTLVDSIGATLLAFKRLFRENRLPEPDDAKITASFGKSGRGIIRALLKDADEKTVDALTEEYRAISYELLCEIRLMKGAKEVLAFLKRRNVKTAIATNRGASTKKLLKMLGLLEYFDAVVTAEHTKNLKPHPEALLLAAKKLGVKPGEALFVGDTAVDFAAGNAAGIKTVLLDKELKALSDVKWWLDGKEEIRKETRCKPRIKA